MPKKNEQLPLIFESEEHVDQVLQEIRKRVNANPDLLVRKIEKRLNPPTEPTPEAG